jgi:hypothetical protein
MRISHNFLVFLFLPAFLLLISLVARYTAVV